MVADPGELEPGDELGEFQIVRRIGVGGMGVVYLAEDQRLGRNVALKVIAPQLAGDAEFQRRFEAEARNAAAIDDHHVVPIYSAGSADGRLYIAMRFIDGTDLGTVIGESSSLAPRRAAAIVIDVASALDAAHAVGLVHRDVKPANVLLAGGRGTGKAFLTDFGLTKGLQAGATQLTGTGLVPGTPDYMAPEQIQGGRIDARTDVYALGCVLHEMLSGSVPYPGNEPMQKMWGHVHEPVPSLPADHDPGLGPVIRRATAKDPDERFPSASDLARAAHAAAEGTRIETAERSVATGAAASGVAESDPSTTPTRTIPMPTVPRAPAPTQPPTEQFEPPPRQLGKDSRSRGLSAAVIGAAVLVAGGLVAAALVISNGKSGSSGGRTVASLGQTGNAVGSAENEASGSGRAVSREASSSSAEVSTPYSQSLYTVEIPTGWTQEESDEGHGAYVESTWHDPSDPNTTILIDSEAPASGDPIASAESVRTQTSQDSDYVEQAFEPTTISGRPAARWVFDVSGDRRVDYFFYDCDVGLAVLGSTSPADFGSVAGTFHEVASSVTVPCGE